MRWTLNPLQRLGSVPIEDVKIDPKSRDDIPALLKGLQLIYADEGRREKLFALLEKHVLPGRSRTVGRPGMDLWRILVIGVLKQGYDFDHLLELVNHHKVVRQMLGHGCDDLDGEQYGLQTLMKNCGHMTPELLREVNQLVVETGHEVSGRKPGAALVGRCDSFVVETDVHYPTDVSLLWDAMRCLIRTAGRACKERGIAGWRQHKHLTKQVRKRFQKVRTAQRSRAHPEAVADYLAFCRPVVERAEKAAAMLEAMDCGDEAEQVRRFIGHALRQIDQVDRRLLKGESIPQEEKVFSIFEEHTRWISKGKAGRPVELGVPVCIVEDQRQFILGHRISWQGGDVDAALPLVCSCQEAHPELRGCSFDRGFHSPGNRAALDGMLDLNALPKKGKLSRAEREREAEAAFAAARRRHPAVESAVNNLEHRGLDRVRAHGAEGFELFVGLSVLALNFHRIGLLLIRRERKKMLRAAKRRRKAGLPRRRRSDLLRAA